MNRRSFFSTLAGGAAAIALDPERALWVPGAKLISIPAPALVTDGWADESTLRPGDRISFAQWHEMYEVVTLQSALDIADARRRDPRLIDRNLRVGDTLLLRDAPRLVPHADESLHPPLPV